MSAPPPRPRRIGLPYWLARAIAGLLRAASRATGREGGSLPGKALLALTPSALVTIARRRRGIPTVLVSATNGKTTLTAMLAEMLGAAGLDVVHNATGANLRSGIATTLMQAGRRGDVTILETDEATLPLVAPDLAPDVIVFGNLFRDQLDRYGELETLADRWRETLDRLDSEATTIVYNADDPLITALVEEHVDRAARVGVRAPVVPFGLGDATVAQAGLPHAADSKYCRRCQHPLRYERSWVGHLGVYACTSCEFARPDPVVVAEHVDLDGLASSRLDIAITTTGEHVTGTLRIPGLYNVYNAVAAVATATVALRQPASVVAEGLASVSPAFGRFERIPTPGGGTLTLLLVKNPTGLNEVVRTLVSSGVDLTATLFALNDGIADGRDVSWVWDADLEPLFEQAGALVVSGDRAAEFGLRAVYGGLDPDGVLLEPDIEQGLFRLLERAREFTDHRHAYALVTYTSMLRLRAIVAQQGWTRAYWANEPSRSAAGRRR